MFQPVELFYEDLQNDPLGSLQKIAWELGVPPPQSLPHGVAEGHARPNQRCVAQTLSK